MFIIVSESGWCGFDQADRQLQTPLVEQSFQYEKQEADGTLTQVNSF